MKIVEITQSYIDSGELAVENAIGAATGCAITSGTRLAEINGETYEIAGSVQWSMQALCLSSQRSKVKPFKVAVVAMEEMPDSVYSALVRRSRGNMELPATEKAGMIVEVGTEPHQIPEDLDIATPRLDMVEMRRIAAIRNGRHVAEYADGHRHSISDRMRA